MTQMGTKQMSDEARDTLNKLNESFNDWAATCPKCKANLKGTLKELREHSCGTQS